MLIQTTGLGEQDICESNWRVQLSFFLPSKIFTCLNLADPSKDLNFKYGILKKCSWLLSFISVIRFWHTEHKSKALMFYKVGMRLSNQPSFSRMINFKKYLRQCPQENETLKPIWHLCQIFWLHLHVAHMHPKTFPHTFHCEQLSCRAESIWSEKLVKLMKKFCHQLCSIEDEMGS